MKRDLFYLDSYIIQKDMRIRLPKAAAINLGLECGKSLLEVYVDKENKEIILKLAEDNSPEDSNS